jgi:predicted secreted protein
MEWTSILAIYFLIWIATAFVMLPFGVRTAEEEGKERVPGQAESAPVNFRPGRLALRATVLAAVLTGIYVVNYQQGWIEAEDLDFMPEPPAHLQR